MDLPRPGWPSPSGRHRRRRTPAVPHPQWRARRDRRKFTHVRDVAVALPKLRRRVSADLNSIDPDRARVLALAVRLLDLGLFRVGGDAYATGEDP
ncbi:MAG TPA: DNA topoisomerase IB, partial [Micromonosporaceae bacterium]